MQIFETSIYCNAQGPLLNSMQDIAEGDDLHDIYHGWPYILKKLILPISAHFWV